MYQPRVIERAIYDSNFDNAIKMLLSNFEEQQKQISELKKEIKILKETKIERL